MKKKITPIAVGEYLNSAKIYTHSILKLYQCLLFNMNCELFNNWLTSWNSFAKKVQ